MKPVIPFSVSIISADKAPSGSIQEGSEVFVRVLGSEGAGRYTVSFAGQRFSVASRRVLETGSAFKAFVRIEKGQVLLVPRTDEGTFSKKTIGITRFSSLNADKTGNLLSLLHELGLPPDSLSFRLISFFQESGIRFNKQAALKARSFAKRFPGREASAAEAALLLIEKGIEPDEASVSELTALFYGGHTADKNKNSSAQTETFRQPDKKNNGHDSFIDAVYADAADCLSLPAGLLSFLNQYKTGDKHWVFLPFDYQYGDFNLNGVIRILFDLGQKRTEKLVISAFSLVKDYFFVVYYSTTFIRSSKSVVDVDFCINPPPSPLRIKDFERFLYGMLPANTKVRYKPELLDTGEGSGMHFFSRVEEKA